jgi:response regulator RpfG family c-di-GMP phosphodiesterase
MVLQDTRIIDLTVAQLAEVIDRAVEESLARRQTQDSMPRFVYGIKGIAQILGVSERQARYIKSTGLLRKAIKQQGRTIITDVNMALQLFGQQHS